jgi:hypothetical protein
MDTRTNEQAEWGAYCENFAMIGLPAEIKIQKKVLRVFLLASHSHLHSFAFKFTQPLTVSIVQILYTVKEKGAKPDIKPYHLPYGSRSPYRNLKSDNSQEYAQKPQRNCTFMNLASAQCTSISPQVDLNFATFILQ